MTGSIVALAIIAALFWIIRKGKNSASVVVTGPGVLKTHDVECKFRRPAEWHGKLSQSRWSDGQERFTLNLRSLPGRYSGPVSLTYKGEHIADFEAKYGKVAFAAKGMVDDGKPQFDIGEEVRLEFGGQILTGIVEPD
ncbi:hypothetical protein [Qipengyuania vesicularis]|uniref:hypothetical protein n=1 Tax=Qipengyuania vesicularis TaxID=2867232 RepID=UPI001C885B0E|nr:hypothetical protein [Qipengyuania vesicularis]MBX7528596.1 hypothetical protein [Qipengyuania vesicularis]